MIDNNDLDFISFSQQFGMRTKDFQWKWNIFVWRHIYDDFSMTWNRKVRACTKHDRLYTTTRLDEVKFINKMNTTEWWNSGTGLSQGGGWGETRPLRGLAPRPSGSEQRYALCEVWCGTDTHKHCRLASPRLGWSPFGLQPFGLTVAWPHCSMASL